MQKTIYGPPCSNTVVVTAPPPPPPPPQPLNSVNPVNPVNPVNTYIKRVTDILTNLKADMDKEHALNRIDTLKSEVDAAITRKQAK